MMLVILLVLGLPSVQCVTWRLALPPGLNPLEHEQFTNLLLEDEIDYFLGRQRLDTSALRLHMQAEAPAIDSDANDNDANKNDRQNKQHDAHEAERRPSIGLFSGPSTLLVLGLGCLLFWLLGFFGLLVGLPRGLMALGLSNALAGWPGATVPLHPQALCLPGSSLIRLRFFATNLCTRQLFCATPRRNFGTGLGTSSWQLLLETACNKRS